MPYCPSCGGPVADADVVCEHCGGTLRREPDDESVAAPDGVTSDERANGHADHQEQSGTAGPGQPRREPPDAGRRMLLKAFGGFGVLAGGAVVAFGGDGGTAAPAQTDDSVGEVAPTASFTFDYHSDADTVTVTHDGGDPVRADELYVRGDRLEQTGTWRALGGGASGSMEGVEAVVGGNSADVGVLGADYVVRVVWQSSETDQSAEFALDRGPQA